MRIRDWSSDVCSSDLHSSGSGQREDVRITAIAGGESSATRRAGATKRTKERTAGRACHPGSGEGNGYRHAHPRRGYGIADDHHRRATDPKRSEEHTSELQSLMRISYAVFCLKKKKQHRKTPTKTPTK